MGRPWHNEDQVYFISSKRQKLSSCWGHGGEARRPGLCWARPPPPLPMPAACGPISSTHLPTNLGHTNRISAGPSADPMRPWPHARSRPQVAAPRLGMLLLGLWQVWSLPHGPHMWHGPPNLCFAGGEGWEVPSGGLSALARPGGLLSPSQKEEERVAVQDKGDTRGVLSVL